MSVTTALYIALAVIFALGFVFFKYLYKQKKRTGVIYSLAILTFISVFTLLILLINPNIVQKQYETIKPKLNVLIDQSSSIAELGQTEKVKAFYKRLLEDEDLMERFDLQTYGLGDDLNSLNKDSISFDKNQTNINKSLSGLSKLKSEGNSAMLLISDGNQTVGEDYSFFKANEKTSIFPIIVGDTTFSPDVYISNLNVNKYAFLNNKFSVEIIANYNGKNAISSNLKVVSGDKVLSTQKVNFSNDNSSQVVRINLEAKSIGTHVYKVEIDPIKSEKNIINNSQSFAVEVIDERTSVLIVSSVLHPDLGMLKKSIESNKQREVKLSLIEDIEIDKISDFELIVLYQPNNKFKLLFDQINENKINNLMITGSQTDWNFLNSQVELFNKSSSSTSQEYRAVYNPNYSQFQFDDINFQNFPPVEDKFGSVEFKAENYQTLLNKTAEGILSKEPLLFTYLNQNQKNGVLLGENMWRWRAQSFVDNGSFEDFDNFFGKLIQFLSSTRNKNRLSLDVEPFYRENEELILSAEYFDMNYVFDPNAELELKIFNKDSKETLNTQMLLDGNEYVFRTSNLKPGYYKVQLKETNSGLILNKEFSVIEFNVEHQFTKADAFRMEKLAKNNHGKMFTPNTFNLLKDQLLQDKRFVSIQKSREKSVSLINWKILLAVLILSLSAEWFTRKYYGLI